MLDSTRTSLNTRFVVISLNKRIGYVVISLRKRIAGAKENYSPRAQACVSGTKGAEDKSP
eukprot:CAMPEP_0173402924 /NCGR_PEP_ID=MMETSP1356-20130122/55352_1 /TAXON_ID=77927 ORGANISM="Hemiselmis virescens, Strain PCC157" /NCGR_SAMPLE_ID=MMETSP1356 /ASSEMBLY_ACC=CAM_ASM_000847 /LENGTH=59 /DNA_ID=CAMNT_0014363353 /DNA_START=80 /DNA_END=255 /DNA_ORIENTATION=+